jgi:hypothetical protein
MNNEVLRILAGQMDAPPDDLLSIDRDFNEREKHMPDEDKEFSDGMIADIRTILNDESLSIGIRLGFVISSCGITISKLAGQLPSHIYKDLYEQSMHQEREHIAGEVARQIGQMFGLEFQVIPINLDDLDSPDPANAPQCEICDEKGAWCMHHRRWECFNQDCPFVGEIKDDSDDS